MGGLYLGGKLVTPVIEKEVAKTKFGASVDTWIGDVDENGVCSAPTNETHVDFTGIKEVGSDSFYHTFNYNPTITKVKSGTITTVRAEGMQYTFDYCLNIMTADFSSVRTVADYGLYSTFFGCSKLEEAYLNFLETVGTQGLCGALGSCGALKAANLSSLKTVGSSGLSRTFRACPKIPTLSFPSLTDVQPNSFGTSTATYIFYNCTALTEIHFRADMQATIEAMTGYADKWGATNATIYFDLIGTITVNSVAYSRSEPDSIYVDHVKTYVAWKDASDNIVYTDATAEPAVDTVVYSDQGTTQAGTVSEVA